MLLHSPKISIFIGRKNLYSSTDCEDMCSTSISVLIFTDIFYLTNFVFSPSAPLRRYSYLERPCRGGAGLCAPSPGDERSARAEKRERDFPSPITLHMWTGGFLHMPAHVEVFLCTFKRHNYKGCLQFLIGCKLRA